jgi:hypothetical protein
MPSSKGFIIPAKPILTLSGLLISTEIPYFEVLWRSGAKEV